MSNLQVKVGVGILVFKKGKVLLGKRRGAHGVGEYAGTGGHLEFGESYEECARRECKEEAGIEIKNIRFLCLSSIRQYKNKHYVDVGLLADWKKGEPKVLEPEKCDSWEWFGLDNLPTPLFGNEKFYFEALKTGKNFFDKETAFSF